jgi:hypothetical protein
MAQVYSVNAVGYVNKSIPKKVGAALTYALLANPLNGTNNNINTIIPSAPDGTLLYKFSGGTFVDPETYFTGVGWIPGSFELPPGEAFFVALDNAVATDPTVMTFVGEVPQGTLVNAMANGYSMRSSIVPQAGGITTDLGLSPTPDSQIYLWNLVNQSYDDPFTYFEGVGWIPSEPNIPVAEGFFYLNTAAAFNWTRNFSVN